MESLCIICIGGLLDLLKGKPEADVPGHEAEAGGVETLKVRDLDRILFYFFAKILCLRTDTEIMIQGILFIFCKEIKNLVEGGCPLCFEG